MPTVHWGCLFSVFVQSTDRCHRVETQLQQINGSYYNPTLYLPSPLDGGGWSKPSPAALPPGKRLSTQTDGETGCNWLTERAVVALFHFPQLSGTESNKSQSEFSPTGTYRTSWTCSECSASLPTDWGKAPTSWALRFAHFTPLDSLMLGHKRNVTYAEMLRDLRPLWRLSHSAGHTATAGLAGISCVTVGQGVIVWGRQGNSGTAYGY